MNSGFLADSDVKKISNAIPPEIERVLWMTSGIAVN